MPYIYKFFNDDNKIIYVGKATSIEARIGSHHHLPKECYEQCSRVEYAKTTNKADVLIYEPYYINKDLPEFNVSMKCDHHPSVKLKELKFILYKGKFSSVFTKLHKETTKDKVKKVKSQLKKDFNDDIYNKFGVQHRVPNQMIRVYHYLRNVDGERSKRLPDIDYISYGDDVSITKYTYTRCDKTYIVCDKTYIACYKPCGHCWGCTLDDIIELNGIDVSNKTSTEVIDIIKHILRGYRYYYPRKFGNTSMSITIGGSFTHKIA